MSGMNVNIIMCSRACMFFIKRFLLANAQGILTVKTFDENEKRIILQDKEKTTKINSCRGVDLTRNEERDFSRLLFKS